MSGKSAIIFIGGGLLGGFMGYYFAKYKSRQEIDDIVAGFEEERKSYEEKESSSELSDAEQRAYGKKLREEGYLDEDTEDDVNSNEEKELCPEEYPDVPYVISYNQFSFEHTEDYDKVPLEYYDENGVLVNDSNEILDICQVIGEDALNHVGEEEENLVFVRNDKYGSDYEVQVIHSKYDIDNMGVNPGGDD